MKLLIDIQRLKDQELILSLLSRLNIPFSKIGPANISETEYVEALRIIQQGCNMTSLEYQQEICQTSDKPLLAKHIGKLPSIDMEALEKHIKQTREEWDRPVSS